MSQSDKVKLSHPEESKKPLSDGYLILNETISQLGDKMIKIGELMTIETLRKQGRSSRQIAKLMGISRNTVKKYFGQHNPPVYHRSEPYKSKPDGFKEYILEALRACPEVTAERLHRELKERGYVRYQNNWYSVPWSHVGRSVIVKVYES